MVSAISSHRSSDNPLSTEPTIVHQGQMTSVSPNRHHHIQVEASPKKEDEQVPTKKPTSKQQLNVSKRVNSINGLNNFALPKDGKYAYPYRREYDEPPRLTRNEFIKKQIAIYYHYTFCWFHLLFNIFMMAVCAYSLIAAPKEALTIYMVLVTLYQFVTCGVCVFSINGTELRLQIHTLFNAFATIFHSILVLIFICVFHQALSRLSNIDASNANYSTVISFYTLLREFHVLFRVIICLDLVGLILSVFFAKWEINYYGRSYESNNTTQRHNNKDVTDGPTRPKKQTQRTT